MNVVILVITGNYMVKAVQLINSVRLTIKNIIENIQKKTNFKLQF